MVVDRLHHLVSDSCRQFIERDIVKFAENNPHAAVYLKPRKGRQPVVVAEYRE